MGKKSSIGMGMDVNWPVVFQGLKTVLDPIAAASWPIAIGIVVWAFRNQIRAMIARVRQVSGFGVTSEFASQEVGTQQSVDATKAASIAVISDTGTLPLPDPVYDILDSQLIATLDQHVKSGADVKLAWAIRSRSISEANRMHETNYRLMFGSQIQALKALNVIGQSPLGEFEKFFANVASNPANDPIHKDRTFAQWAEFIANVGYATPVEGSDPQQVQITPFGRQFLQWMIIAGVSEFKPG